ncbi:uncharacterized protein MYCGRDRAFT_92720 [Zymoseptoria tritici IPO323]|uniref:Uncharacterized protein n=1 Tax=Zymoseptoria tritici (strain CBS 115943 / IPO323) TaxID=336722 RepID=F9X9Z2_ZYMTI|nr:uncharacterized protein MYCGRDRAFT_92720 [Zymoseptoria tritici IPO323]EGP88063.1 hypothetical protein MYCGRDRAFT_92720 [Zymoseptoria tritici IPO323]
MAAAKKQSPAKAAAAKKAKATSSPEPGPSTRSSPRKKAASPAKKASSPAKKAASPAKKTASPARKAASPAKKAASPAKRAASPVKKATATKVPMVEYTEARLVDGYCGTNGGSFLIRSVTPAETKSAPSKVTKTTKAKAKSTTSPNKDVLKKRGLLDEDDDNDDSTQTTEEVLAMIDGRKRTKWDKIMVDLLKRWEDRESGNLVEVEEVHAPFEEEARLSQLGQPLNCHAKIYWRFHHELRPIFPMQDEFDEIVAGLPHQSIEQADVKRKSPSKGAAIKRSPSKSPAKSPTRAHHEPITMTRPMRRSSSKSPVKETAPRSPSKGIKTAEGLAGMLDEYEELTKDGSSGSLLMKATEQQAYEATLENLDTPEPPTGLPITEQQWRLAWFHGVRRAGQVVHDSDSADDDAGPSTGRSKVRSSLTATRPSKTQLKDLQRQYKAQPPSKLFGPTNKKPIAKGNFESPGRRLHGQYNPVPVPPPYRMPKKHANEFKSPTSAEKTMATARSPTASPGKQQTPSRSTAATTVKPVPTLQPVRTSTLPNPPLVDGRGPVISVNNPPYLPGTDKPNPFFEYMPAPEVWHRRMPNFFSFGETPYMEQVMSDQINEDLARNHDEPRPSVPDATPVSAGFIDRFKSGVTTAASAVLGRSASASAAPESPAKEKSHKKAPAALRPTMWALPYVSDEEVWKLVEKDSHGPRAGETDEEMEEVPSPRKRKAAAAHAGRAKRSRG